tara:strand:- start:582 stop:1112 length:531 start_codon:yes stop_codon:yes gene_type:complete
MPKKQTKKKSKPSAKVVFNKRELVFRKAKKEGRGKNAKTIMVFTKAEDTKEAEKRTPERNYWVRMAKELIGDGKKGGWTHYHQLVKWDPSLRVWSSSSEVDLEGTIKKCEQRLLELKMILASNGYDNVPSGTFTLKRLNRETTSNQVAGFATIAGLEAFKSSGDKQLTLGDALKDK